ncbi:uncharacterized mitochondrial protein AtMg00810-like [Capsicum annuum]|uniref:uncharacterized mitochondrial protein AtMg00810-like n=1 Tax=Capsicum annuum TaxID=4072 RepID=UPI001FB082E2|nr:uncharacterized mitochondrial protein AtMg00810-like [Capsicum annuum]
MVSVRSVIAVAAAKDWPLYQMDVNNVYLQGSSQHMIDATKQMLHNRFKVKDSGVLKYFLGIEVMRSNKGIILNQRKYTLELILGVGMSGGRPASTPMEMNTKAQPADLFTKGLGVAQHHSLLSKLGVLDVFRPSA